MYCTTRFPLACLQMAAMRPLASHFESDDDSLGAVCGNISGRLLVNANKTVPCSPPTLRRDATQHSSSCGQPACRPKATMNSSTYCKSVSVHVNQLRVRFQSDLGRQAASENFESDLQGLTFRLGEKRSDYVDLELGTQTTVCSQSAVRYSWESGPD